MSIFVIWPGILMTDIIVKKSRIPGKPGYGGQNFFGVNPD